MLYISLVIWTNLQSPLLRERLTTAKFKTSMSTGKQTVSLIFSLLQEKLSLHPWSWRDTSNVIQYILSVSPRYCAEWFVIFSSVFKNLKIRHQPISFSSHSSAMPIKWSPQIGGHEAERTYWGITVTHSHIDTQDSSLTGEYLPRITMREMAMQYRHCLRDIPHK